MKALKRRQRTAEDVWKKENKIGKIQKRGKKVENLQVKQKLNKSQK